MAIQNLPEFAKNGQKNTDGLVLLDGFPVNKKPARQWMNFLFNQLTVAINAINAEKLDATSNAVSASKWQTPRKINASGAATGSVTFDGSKDEQLTLTLANSGVKAGTYGNNITIPVPTVNEKGLITVVATQTIRSANTNQTGVVQLVDALNDSSITKAPTANQVKILNERLNSAGVYTKAPTFTGTDLLVDVPDVCQTFTLSGTYTNTPQVFGNGSITGMLDVKKRWFDAGVQKILTIRHLSGQIWENVKNVETWGGWKRIDAIDAVRSDQIGVSGGKIPLLNTDNTWSGANTFAYRVMISRPRGVPYLGLSDSKATDTGKTEFGRILFGYGEGDLWGMVGVATFINAERDIDGKISLNLRVGSNQLTIRSDGKGLYTGNAASATKLETPRKINSVPFDATQDIEIQPSSVRILKNADLNTYLDEGFFFCPSNVDVQTIKNKPARNHAFSLHVEKNAVSTQTLKYYITTGCPKVEVWVRSKFENIVNGGLWGEWERLAYTSDDITGNAATATKLQTPRNFNLSGDASGTVKFDGSSDVTLQVKLTNNALDVVAYSPIPYPKNIAPTGFLMMMGQTISATQYPILYGLYGSRLPDMRGEFIRGWDAGRGVDIGRPLLGWQNDELRSHNHPVILNKFGHGREGVWSGEPRWSSGDVRFDANPINPDSVVGFSGGPDTRPRNIAFNYIVKAG